MTRYIIAAFAFIILVALAVPGFAGIPADHELKTSADVSQFYDENQQNSN